MPVKRCQSEGRPGYRWGELGKCFTGPDARARASEQGRAIEARRLDQADPLVRALSTPSGVRRQHGALWLRRVRQLHEAIRDTLSTVSPLHAQANLLLAGQAWRIGRPPPRGTLQLLAERLGRQSTTATARAVARMTGAPRRTPQRHADPATAAWVEATARGMLQLEARALSRAALRASQALSAGATRAETLSILRRLQRQDRATAATHAEDQLNTLRALVVRASLRTLGVHHALWVHTCPEGPGCDHGDRHGTVVALGPLGEIDFPGEGVGCRCVALPAVGL